MFASAVVAALTSCYTGLQAILDSDERQTTMAQDTYQIPKTDEERAAARARYDSDTVSRIASYFETHGKSDMQLIAEAAADVRELADLTFEVVAALMDRDDDVTPALEAVRGSRDSMEQALMQLVAMKQDEGDAKPLSAYKAVETSYSTDAGDALDGVSEGADETDATAYGTGADEGDEKPSEDVEKASEPYEEPDYGDALAQVNQDAMF